MYKMKQIFATVLCVLVYLHTISGKHNQRPDPIKSSERHGRKLIRDTDFRKCFDIDYKKGYADYLLNPFKANDDRGDWGNLNSSAAVVLLLLIFLNSSNRKMHAGIVIWCHVVIKILCLYSFLYPFILFIFLAFTKMLMV